MIALIVMLSVGLFIVCVVEANPVPRVPATELPTLITQAPDSSSPIYAYNDLEFNFSVIIPQTWDLTYMGNPTVGSAGVFLYLDGVPYYTYDTATIPPNILRFLQT